MQQSMRQWHWHSTRMFECELPSPVWQYLSDALLVLQSIAFISTPPAAAL